MKRTGLLATAVTLGITVALLAGCSAKGKVNEADMAPPQANVLEQPDLNIVKVDRPERFALVTAGKHEEMPQLEATGTINPDIENSVPVISLASGRAVAVYAKIGDDVTKGQLLLKVMSNDISSAFQTYRQAQADEQLTRRQLDRAKLLYDHGAISLNDYEVAQDTEQKAQITLNTAVQAIRTLGADPDHPDPVVNISAPISGTIVEQNVVNGASVHTPDNQQSLFTIANLSTVWAICNVYENDLPNVRLNDRADVQLNAYRDRTFHGRISNIGKVLDPNLRTVPVRITLTNPGMMRTGMFVTATFFGQHGRVHATVPSGAVLHLHDRDWVFVPSGNGAFRRTEISAGTVENGQQNVLSGITPGQQVVGDALALSSESQQ